MSVSGQLTFGRKTMSILLNDVGRFNVKKNKKSAALFLG